MLNACRKDRRAKRTHLSYDITRSTDQSSRYANISECLFFVYGGDFLFLSGFFSQPPANNRTAGEGEGIPLTPHCHFHPLHRYLGNSWAIAAEGSPLHISSKPYTNRGTLVSNRKSLTTRLRTLFLKVVSNDLV